MGIKKQTDKNITLTQKLVTYLMKSKSSFELPPDVSFVPFSKTDKKLNAANQTLLEQISKGEKPVIKAEELKTPKGAWKLIPINF